MRGLDEQERAVLARSYGTPCGHHCAAAMTAQSNRLDNLVHAIHRMRSRGLIETMPCPFSGLHHSRRTPLGQRILELDRIAREGGLGL
jgi:hypothetical protein